MREHLPAAAAAPVAKPRVAWRGALPASVASLSLVAYGADAAWAACLDGTTFPQGGYVVGRDLPNGAANWSPSTFTGTTGSVWVPDTSVHELNDPAGPLTGGGHDWVFDQGFPATASTLCKATDTGPAGAPATGWAIPPDTPASCIFLPVISNGAVVTNVPPDVPRHGDVITPTCDPTKLSTATKTNPANTYLNQLGCSISASQSGGTPVATTPQTATSWLFVAGEHGGLFSVRLDNVADPVQGGDAGKAAGLRGYYGRIPEGQKLSSATVSPDGRFVIATSRKQRQPVWACLDPLGDPGDPGKPIPKGFTVPPASTVKCMQVGSNALKADLVTEFGPDGQPYFGGQRVVNSFGSQPGGTAVSAWPQCTYNGFPATGTTVAAKLASVFKAKSPNHCGSAVPNAGSTSALLAQPNALIRHVAPNGDWYLYTDPVGGTVVQFKLTSAANGTTTYKARTYVTGLSITTGLGIAEDQKSLMIYADPSGSELAGQEVVTRLPLCEDMP